MEAGASAPPPPPPLVYADSIDSSPRSRNTDSWDDPSISSFSSGPSSKLRLMCSYGGHIVPRPHDKSLCYLGGDTRIVVVDRSTLSLSSLSSKLSSTLLEGRSFALKYQLPNEDLDSLISVTTDEDLENMIDEYDRTMAAASSHKPSRLRLFLFPSKPESASSIGSLLDDSKSETWFVEALNGAGILPRGLSAVSADSADVNCLLGLDDSGVNGVGGAAGTGSDQKNHNPDSPMLETASSSFGSTSSAHFLSNLPPIRVHVDDGNVRQQDPKMGIEEQFNQMNVGGAVAVSAATTAVPAATTTISPSNENQNRVFSDDERVEQGVPVSNRKPPQPPQQQQQQQHQQQLTQQKQNRVDASSTDAVARDNSNLPRPKAVYYQDPVAGRDKASIPTTLSSMSDPKRDASDPNYRIPIPIQDPNFPLSTIQQEQQQYIHTTPHYIHHPATGPVPISSFYQMHPMHQPQTLQPQLQQPPVQQQQQQQQQQHHQQQQQHHHQQQQHHQHQHRIDHQYPMYFIPVGQNPSYAMAPQSNLVDGSANPSSKPPLAANSSVVPPSYKDSAPMYPPRSAPKTELAPNLYRTAATMAPPPHPNAAAPLIHMADQQQQYVGYHQIPHPSQSTAANFPYVDPLHAQIYYTQPTSATLAPQYQTVNSGAMISEAMVPSQPAAAAETKLNRTLQPL